MAILVVALWLSGVMLLGTVLGVALRCGSVTYDDDVPQMLRMHHAAGEQVVTTQQKLWRYMHGYARWASAHPHEACPDKLTDLTKYTDGEHGFLPTDANDAWGRPIKMLCRPSQPGFAVMSMGPDGKAGTEDDILSWE